MTSRDKLREQLTWLRRDEGATPRRLEATRELMAALGASNGEDASRKLEELLRTAFAGTTLKDPSVTVAALNSYGFGPAAATSLGRRRELMVEAVGCSASTIINREKFAITELLNSLLNQHESTETDASAIDDIDKKAPAAKPQDLEAEEERDWLADVVRSIWRKIADNRVASIAILVPIALFATTGGFYWYEEYGPGSDYANLRLPSDQFEKLTVANQVNACVPYVRENLPETIERWRQALRVGGLAGPPDDFEVSPVPKGDDDAQLILTRQLATIELARVERAGIGKNILPCAMSIPTYNAFWYQDMSSVVQYREVVAASEVSATGKMGNISANGFPSRILQVSDGCQIMFSFMRGREGTETWVQRAHVCDKNASDWVKDLSKWK